MRDWGTKDTLGTQHRVTEARFGWVWEEQSNRRSHLSSFLTGQTVIRCYWVADDSISTSITCLCTGRALCHLDTQHIGPTFKVDNDSLTSINSTHMEVMYLHSQLTIPRGSVFWGQVSQTEITPISTDAQPRVFKSDIYASLTCSHSSWSKRECTVTTGLMSRNITDIYVSLTWIHSSQPTMLSYTTSIVHLLTMAWPLTGCFTPLG